MATSALSSSFSTCAMPPPRAAPKRTPTPRRFWRPCSMSSVPLDGVDQCLIEAVHHLFRLHLTPLIFLPNISDHRSDALHRTGPSKMPAKAHISLGISYRKCYIIAILENVSKTCPTQTESNRRKLILKHLFGHDKRHSGFYCIAISHYLCVI